MRKLSLIALLLAAAPLVQAQTGSPDLKQPPEIEATNHKLRAAIAMRDADIQIPNVGKRHLRYFQGVKLPNDVNELNIPARPLDFTPGPTLRARVGDTLQVMFFNEVNDNNFQYTDQNGTDCDQTFTVDATGKTVAAYPYHDHYPNCFHASSTANLHYHGTHTSPDGVGDNVLVEVMPDKDTSRERMWAAIFEQIFKGPIPQHPTELPPEYWKEQNKLLTPAQIKANENRIAHGEWPQYIAQAFPNYLVLPGDPAGGSGFVAGQAPGTHWYHAHKHGSTALHMLNGLAGVFIIEGPYDDFLRCFYGLSKYGNFEKVLILQQVSGDIPLEKQAPGPVPPVLVNGQMMPIIDMKQGEVQLWRIVNATTGSGNAANLNADFFKPANGFAVKQTAQDGVQFSPANYQSQPFLSGAPGAPPLALSAGNRADILVKAPNKAGTFPFTSNGKVVLYVRVSDQSHPMPFPGEGETSCAQKTWPNMPGYLTDLGKPADFYPHTVTFGWDPEPGRTSVPRLNAIPPKFTIDNRQFAERGLTVDQCVRMGDGKDNLVQDWVLVNATPTAHPFHIHVNPFQVLTIERPVINGTTGVVSYQVYAPPSDNIWLDVVTIPAGVAVNTPDTTGKTATQRIIPGRVTIRQRFVDFTGTFVLHCHILAHEDRGMMQLVRVVHPSEYPERCQAMVPEHH